MVKRKHEEDGEETLLGNCEEGTSAENTGDTLGNTQDTLNRLEKGICTMTESIVSMNRAIEQMSTQERLGQIAPRKRSRHDGTPDTGSEEWENDISSDEENLLPKNRQEAVKCDLLDEIAMELEAEKVTDTDVSEKLAKIVNKRWTEKLNPDKLSEKLKKHSRLNSIDSPEG
eukprot:gene4299-4868_t